MDLRNRPLNFRSRLKVLKGRTDLTPMVDVLFLLLIFFMLSSSFVQVSGIKVDLPKISYGSNLGVEKFVITIDESNNIFFNDQPIGGKWDVLKEKLSQLGSRSESGIIVLRADNKTPFGTVAKVMSLAEEANLSVFLVTVQPEKGTGKTTFKDPESDE